MEMMELKIFTSENFGRIRSLGIEGKPYFVGKDIADALGYKNGSRDIERHVKEEDRQKYQIGTPDQKRVMTVINESGLYSLVLSSKLKKAEQFKHWVTSEVLPSIRENGIYATEKLLSDPDFAIKVFTQLKNQREENKKLEEKVEELTPKANYTDMVLQNSGLIPITKIAKDYGMGASAMNSMLNDCGVQYKQGNQWLLYAKYQNKGYTGSSTIDIKHKNGFQTFKMETKWTQRGRMFLYELLKKKGILPIVERG